MPYRIVKVKDKHCVQKTDDRKLMGCHKTEDEARAQMRALYASEDED